MTNLNSKQKISHLLASVYIYNNIYTSNKKQQPKNVTVEHLQIIQGIISKKLDNLDIHMPVKLSNPILSPSRLKKCGDSLWLIYQNICNNVKLFLFVFATQIYFNSNFFTI